MKSKLISLRSAASIARQLRRKGNKVAFTNGTFDLLHLGHVTYLQKARQQADVLFVGLNSDASVKSYKGPGRPLNPQKDRALVLCALACVDYAVIFNEPTPLRLIKIIRPDVLVKGADWPKSKIAGAGLVESWGGKVRRIRLVPGRSTTRLLQLMKAGAR
ncbi:MAG TPA: D-glycero-beta-D-manno-heptose 1-phosphate adenylyltransferase [bacterium]|nr:D-glycero-beta-D-manno-heptose 1-phosphate adenylyltransferase [bacterium]